MSQAVTTTHEGSSSAVAVSVKTLKPPAVYCVYIIIYAGLFFILQEGWQHTEKWSAAIWLSVMSALYVFSAARLLFCERGGE